MVLELFLTEYFYGKKIKELYENYENDKFTFFMSMAMRLILTLPMTVIAVILAWRCNSSEPTYLRILYTTLAASFSSIYVFFYLVYRIILKHPCKSS